MKNESVEIRNGILFSYINIFIQVIAYALYTPISLRYLGNSEYGVYSLCMSFMTTLGLIEMGLSSAYLKYYIQYKTEFANESKRELEIKKLNGCFLFIFSFLGMIALISGLLISTYPREVFGKGLTEDELNLSKKLLIVLSANIAITIFGMLFRTNIQANERYTFLKGVDVFKTISNPFLGMIMMLFGFKSVAVSIITLIISVTCVLINVCYCKKYIGFSLTFSDIKLGKMKKYFGFSFFVFLNTIMDQLNWQIDKWLLARFTGSVAIAMYSLGSQINTLFIKVSIAISNIFSSKVHILVHEKNATGLNNLFIKVGRIQFFLLMLVYTSFIIFGRVFISYWVGEGYEIVYYIAIMLMTPILVLLSQNLSIEILRAYELHKVQSVINLLIAVVNFLISIPLCKQYGEIGCAMGTLISMGGIYYPFTNFYIKKYTPIQLRNYYKEISKMAIIALTIGAVGYFVYSRISIHSMGLYLFSILIYLIVYIAGLYIFALSCDEKELIKKIFRHFVGRR